MAGAGRFFQERITRTTMLSPRARATKGTIHAVRSKPFAVGAASTVGPYFCTKDCSTRLSLSPRLTAVISSLRMPSDEGQPTWLHSRRIWPQLQMHIIWWPSSLKRVAGSPAPVRAKTARQSRPQCSRRGRIGFCLVVICNSVGREFDNRKSAPRVEQHGRRLFPTCQNRFFRPSGACLVSLLPTHGCAVGCILS